jgi:hypothetical protein
MPRHRHVLAALVVVALGPNPVPGQVLTPGDFTYQFADLDGNPTTTMSLGGNIGSTVQFRVYLVQTGGTPTINQVGVQGVGVRVHALNATIRVRSAVPADIRGNPAFDFITSGGTGTATGTSSSAYVQNGIFDPSTRLPFPQDTGDSMRLLVGTFRVERTSPVLAGSAGWAVEAVDPFGGPTVNIMTGPNPPRPLDPSDPGAEFSPDGPGAIAVDPYLGQYANPPFVPRLTNVPEPSTLFLVGAAAGGLACRRLRTRSATLSP